MEFVKYQHVERFGTTEVEQIELGKCYVFPKIDGTNASVWLDSKGEIQAGSRNRQLSLEKDNAGFFAWVKNQDNLLSYLKENPTHRLFGEWLVPHSLNTYRDTAWRKFYIFDVCTDKDQSEILHEGDSKLNYLHYDLYKPLLEKHDLDYISPISIIDKPSYEQLVKQLPKNVFLIEDGKGSGEGIVIKNYDFRNKYNRQVFAKIVTSEFKEAHAKNMGAPDMKGKTLIEEQIANEFVTVALCEKTYAKIVNENDGWSSKFIPQLLNTVYYDFIKEESWNFIKKFRNPIINFKTLQYFVFNRVKSSLPKVF